MKKTLVICGPTATGKTKLAIILAKRFGGELVSCDSRQVYKDLDIGTGKDIPVGEKIKYFEKSPYGYYEVNEIKLWGYDLVSPKKEYSVSHFIKFGKDIIIRIWEREKLPILVGGTGLYIRGLLDGIPTAEVPKNVLLRENLKEKNTDELYETLAQVDSSKAASLNLSDRKNTRRLVRAIEVAQWLIDKMIITKKGGIFSKSNCLLIGLTAPKDYIKENIIRRVEDRVKRGQEKEITGLLANGVEWTDQSMNTLGYKQWREYFEGKSINKRDIISKWAKDEIKYARRQITWFKKDRRINWFEITNKGYEKEVEKLVRKWYKS